MPVQRPPIFQLDSLDEDQPREFSPPRVMTAGNNAHVKSFEQYQRLYSQSIDDPEGFWTPLAKELHWHEPWEEGRFLEYNFHRSKGPVFIRWMVGGKTNVCYNVLDRHVKNGLGEKIAFFWEGNDPEDCSKISYSELLEQVCKFANVLRSKGVKKGDRVAIYLPMIIPLPVVMLACARIGAVHSIIFGGFSAESLAARIMDAGAKILITADGAFRGVKMIRLKAIADEAVQICIKQSHELSHVIVVRHLACPTTDSSHVDTAGKRPYNAVQMGWNDGLDCWYHEEMENASPECPVEWLDSEDPLFMLYTSGSTGTPKGVLHTQAGYLLYVSTTFRYVFDHQPDDIYWCTADIGWITGHSYITYGPMANAATGIIFEGLPTHPDPGRCWQVVAKYKVNKFYTAPTAIRALMKHGDNFVQKHDRSSLQILGSVGEPINPDVWRWYQGVVGEGRVAVVDTYWQTETGGHVITPLPAATTTKPGSATLPFFGVKPALLAESGAVIDGEGQGYLVFEQPWPGIMRTVYKNHERFENTYLGKFDGYFCTGDGARRDEDGYYWITGRIDDMMNVSGHLLSTAEIESALVSHQAVAEAAVVAAPHDIKGQTPYCFVTLKNGYKMSDELVKELQLCARKKIGPVAVPEVIQEAPGMPKTRSGKIMRRVLRTVAVGDRSQGALGDTSTLADDSVIDNLFRLRPVFS